jgi:23S rRNA (uracil1939-C5)-methyltransferase
MEPVQPSRPSRATAQTGADAALPRLVIRLIGAKGDGVADTADGAVHVPFVLPGETVEARIGRGRAQVAALVEASPERVTPPCAHFGVCGGCALQHWREAPYLDWKAGLVRQALARHRVEAEVAAATPAWGAGRRRATFHARWDEGRLVFGFSQARAHQLVQVGACPVLSLALEAAIPRLRALCEVLVPRDKPASLMVTETLTGLDVDLRGAGRVARFGRAGTERLAGLSEGLARLSLEGEPAVSPAQPTVAVGPARVVLPTGAFLQATQAGEELLAARVVAHAAGARKIADLFAGIGTFALRLKSVAPVLAVEGSGEAVAAMGRAANGLAGGHQLTAQARDLFRAPLAPLELKGIDTVVLDPPRAGAEEQCAQIARSKVARAILISCDPVTFARDTALLVQAGFRLRQVEALDQFRYSPHLEIVALLER